MTDFYVRWGDDVDPYVRRLASEHITTLSKYCDRVIRRILKARARKKRVATITDRVERDMLHELAYHRFSKLGFRFLLKETGVKTGRKLEFVLNFSAKPKFEPDDMPLRLRRRKGKAPSAKPVKGKRRRRAAARIAIGAGKTMEKLLYRIHNAPQFGARAVALVTRFADSTRIMAINAGNRAVTGARTLKLLTLKAWRRRPRVAFSARHLKSLLIGVREPANSAPVRAWLERRDFSASIGLALSLNVLASNDTTIDWDVFPFDEPPEESERLPV